MTAADTVMSSRIRAELPDLYQAVWHAEQLRDKASETGDADYLYAAALELHSFYTRTEQLFELIARNIDESVPHGATWHRDLLQQMVAQVGDRRPPVIRRNTRDCAEEYLAFRHAVRNVYVLKLDTSRVRELVTGVRACYDSLAADLQAFCDFLESLD